MWGIIFFCWWRQFEFNLGYVTTSVVFELNDSLKKKKKQTNKRQEKVLMKKHQMCLIYVGVPLNICHESKSLWPGMAAPPAAVAGLE